MGLLRTGINEIIATTSFNAAPIGIHYRDGVPRMILFPESHTYINVQHDGWVIANIIHDPVLYVQTAFEDLPKDAFVEEPVAGKVMYRLADAEAWIAFTTTETCGSAGGVLNITLKIEKEIIETVAVYPINRGFNSIIDATVHATRYKFSNDPELKKLIDYHVSLIRKCGGKKEIKALDLLLNYIGE